jgi:acetyl coenzyme A synthetase (ADP forming)-like protein
VKNRITDMGPFFNPESVAIVGASENPASLGHTIMRNFTTEGYKGKVFPVNPKYETVLGIRCYKSVLDIKERAELAILSIPARAVPQVMEQCGRKKIKNAVIVTGGFAETGNKDLEDKVRAIINKHGISVVGPNCLGVYDSRTHVDSLFLPQYKLIRPRPGGISFITQSGAVGSVVVDWASARGFGVSKFVSYGNAMDVDEVDVLDYLGKDPDTTVICAYLEGTKRGKKLIEVARKVVCKKPVVAMKVGRGKAGAAAVASHTGSLAGNDRVWDSAFRQAGILRAKDIGDLFDFARIFSEQPLPKGKRVGIVTNGGGFGVLASDNLEFYGLEIPQLSPETIKLLKAGLPEHAVAHNPVDLVGDADAARYKLALDALMADKKIDSILCIALFQTPTMDSKVVDVVTEISDQKKKPIVCVASGGDYALMHMKLLEESGVPSYDSIRSAARSLAALTHYEEFLETGCLVPGA